MEVRMNRKGVGIILALCLCCLLLFPATAEADETVDELIRLYREYEANFASIDYVDLEHVEDLENFGYTPITIHSFSILFESFGEEEVTFIPVIDNTYHRLAVLIVDNDSGNVLYKTNQLETNYKWLGKLEQPTKELVSVSFQDLDKDGLTDIILITDCENTAGDYAGKTYKVGDVLFQKDGSFYRDWRVSDKINRFSMNKSVDFIAAYVRDGNSTETLYTATTLDELLENGFHIIEEQCYYRNFEKQGRLQQVPGVIHMAEYDVFMIYLVNEQGYIVWSFQPMGDYDNLYALRGTRCTDLDGDGMKDLLVLGRYSYAGPQGELLVDTVGSIYYQRTDGFAEDTEFAQTYQCTEKDTVGELVTRIREYWGWTIEE